MTVGRARQVTEAPEDTKRSVLFSVFSVSNFVTSQVSLPFPPRR